MTPEDVVNHVAESIAEAQNQNLVPLWPMLNEDLRDYWRDIARVAIGAVFEAEPPVDHISRTIYAMGWWIDEIGQIEDIGEPEAYQVTAHRMGPGKGPFFLNWTGDTITSALTSLLGDIIRDNRENQTP